MPEMPLGEASECLRVAGVVMHAVEYPNSNAIANAQVQYMALVYALDCHYNPPAARRMEQSRGIQDVIQRARIAYADWPGVQPL